MSFDVGAWLESFGLSQYKDLFIKNGYDDYEVVANIEEEDRSALSDIVPGHWKKIRLQCQKLKEGGPNMPLSPAPQSTPAPAQPAPIALPKPAIVPGAKPFGAAPAAAAPAPAPAAKALPTAPMGANGLPVGVQPVPISQRPKPSNNTGTPDAPPPLPSQPRPNKSAASAPTPVGARPSAGVVPGAKPTGAGSTSSNSNIAAIAAEAKKTNSGSIVLPPSAPGQPERKLIPIHGGAGGAEMAPADLVAASRPDRGGAGGAGGGGSGSAPAPISNRPPSAISSGSGKLPPGVNPVAVAKPGSKPPEGERKVIPIAPSGETGTEFLTQEQVKKVQDQAAADKKAKEEEAKAKEREKEAAKEREKEAKEREKEAKKQAGKKVAKGEEMIAVALFKYEAEAAGDLTIKKGDKIKVIDLPKQNWWMGEHKGKTGLFPITHISPEDVTRIKEHFAELQEEAQSGGSSSLPPPPPVAAAAPAPMKPVASAYNPPPPPSSASSYNPPPPSSSAGAGGPIKKLPVGVDPVPVSKAPAFGGGIFKGSGGPPSSNNLPPPPPVAAAVPKGSRECVIALYDYSAAVPTDLTFSKGTVIKIIEKTNSDWFKGTIDDVVIGDFPSNYVSQVPETDFVTAQYDFPGETPTDLSFKQGDRIQVIARNGDWWQGILNGRSGDFPANFVA